MATSTSSRGIRVAVRGCVLFARLAAEPLRSSLAADGASAVALSCEDALRARGRIGLLRTAIGEWLSIAAAGIRSRLGRRAVITGGSGPELPGPGRRSLPDSLAGDLRQAWRAIVATRSTVSIAVLSLALGIGVNTAVFSILDALIFRPVPYADAGRLVVLWTYYAPGKFSMKGSFTPALVTEWRKQTDLFDRVEASDDRSFIYDGRGGAEMVPGAVVTPGLFTMLGAPARLGRVFADIDGRDGTERHVVVSDRFWREQLGADRHAIGREIVLDGNRYDVVGVMPATFYYPDRARQVWIPYDVAQPPSRLRGQKTSFVPIARMHAGLTRAQTDERVVARGSELNRLSGGDGQGGARVQTIGELFDERTSRSLLVLGGAVLFLLLIVCANVANLTLARSMARGRDLAVRVALGASRAALFRVALVEHALIGVAGAALGLVVAAGAIASAAAVLPSAMTTQSLNAIDLDGRTLLLLSAITSFTILAFGLPPAWLAGRAPAAAALGRDSRTATGSHTASRLRAALVIVEVALAIVLLVGAALMTRSLVKLQAIDMGLDTDGLMSVTLAMPSAGYSDAAVRDEFTRTLLANLRRQPWITHVSAGVLPPNERSIVVGPIEFDDRIGQPTKSQLLPVYATWPGFFQTAGIRLIEGREPREGDVDGAAVVSDGFARKYWPTRSALGSKFKVGKGAWRVVVGVAAEVRRMSEDDDSREYEIYYPHDQVDGVMHAAGLPSQIAEYRPIVVRTTQPGTVAKEMPAAVHAIDGRVIVSTTTLAAHEFADAIARPRIVFVVMTGFAGAGLVLAAAGLYGVLSYLVSLRRREIGVRLALGASPRDIGRLVLRSGLGMAIAGLVIGLGAALGLVRLMRTLLYEVEPSDPLAVALVILLLLATTILASWRPARKAMKVDPVSLLKAE
jgi:predicted permease